MSSALHITNYEDVNSWETLMFLYNAALKEVGTKIDILNEEFQHIHRYNPIEHVKSRIKTPESIVKKLRKNGYDSNIENMVKYVNDIAGIRIICSFTSDIYRIADMIAKQTDLKILSLKDYIKTPKESGYQSYHMIVTVPIFLSDGVVETKVEIQIRTIAQDFWASLEHKIYYKFEGNAPAYISSELQECAKIASQLDRRMLSLNEASQKCSAGYEKDETSEPVYIKFRPLRITRIDPELQIFCAFGVLFLLWSQSLPPQTALYGFIHNLGGTENHCYYFIIN